MDYLLTEEQKMIRDLARKVSIEKALPKRAEWDETGEFPWEALKAFSDADLCGLYIDEAYGGMGVSVFNFCLATEEISRICGGVGVTFAASALGSTPILLFGSEEQKKQYMPPIAAGKKLAAFGLTEASAGSDAAGLETTAVKSGDYYILNGTKQWITNGGEADTYTVIAITDKTKGPRGASAFIVEKGTPGFTFGKKENKMGIRCSATRELVFQDCKIHKSQLLGKEGMGFIVAMKTLDMTRPGIGAQAVGIAQGALDEAIKYAKQRVQFGQPIISLQAIQHMLADMATQVEAARALVYAVAKMIDAGHKDFTLPASEAKLFASDVAMKVTIDAIQIFGGYGYMKEYPVEKMARDAKITQIYEGTNQIQRNQIGLALIKESAKK
ncbi:acyl-CoA dehydrogenase [candidate division WOR-1 bacterium RIFOXYA12_FULL_52_29]|uniref:Acyl-CoA dehydrogenase n=1 Tax=candidate division WOR-1 bacterium RIFOXYC12_FULL_54_18 TaxID=1802584 RepID=A0A1F4TA28_UNCSA|nr:MAG: acyl-CoA dehydrogenase [candidate division WOR-1 bacterium RIFOXYA2_FULL_51_19]OGC18516.1 MAG: acyl-CoA dehydrogenase [candidate division WOR-1 bacterium RIFOXYA12_FULL_52_29]OGC27374.1 MAG: acyl-CoA dehydrogenase [candidate division WOR-1 bacterium RIFOXYB2_FULL_45_9]OGC28933.1 MAG: acyl-CoA dehydrogenase [candidate division WOR-1 bacterium RIFOXYC12_FULL_54_18]OGC31307.1 MAG: acyl-CoA dehydrogenase [candidate division WOR-1 bacterium RIFOXYB12_FULL_52_16]